MANKRDLVVIGGGAGGLVVASVAAQLGLDVVLINKQEAMGGDCLHYGCIPSKALIKSAAIAHGFSHADRWGLPAAKPQIDMQAVNQSIKNAIDNIQLHDSRERFESLGCEVVIGEAVFTSSSAIEVENRKIEAKYFVVATGSSAFIPPVKGLQRINFLTNENMYSLPSLPESMIVLGGGAIGIEMAQAYARLGTEVSIVERAPRLLPTMDKEISAILSNVLIEEGISIYVNSEVLEVTESDGVKQIILKNGEKHLAQSLLVAVGRRPELNSLNLKKAGVNFDGRGIKINKKMQTSNKSIYACGDVTGEIPLTHVAELQAGIVIANMIFKIPKKISYNVIPSVVYSDPEVAQVGLSVEQCQQLKKAEVHQFDVSQLDRAITDNTKIGLAKILTSRGRVVGAHIIAPRAGELIHELALAVQENMKISKLNSLVHAYPTYSQLNKRLAGQYYKDRLFNPYTKKIVMFLNRYFS